MQGMGVSNESTYTRFQGGYDKSYGHHWIVGGQVDYLRGHHDYINHGSGKDHALADLRQGNVTTQYNHTTTQAEMKGTWTQLGETEASTIIGVSFLSSSCNLMKIKPMKIQ